MSTSEAATPHSTDTATAVVPHTTAAERRAARVLQAALVLVVLVALTWKEYELDRFFLPKELVLHAAAGATGLLLLRRVRACRFTWIDSVLAAHLALGVASAVFATNPWLAGRALAITASGLVVFWVARMLQAVGRAWPLLGTVGLAVVLGCVTSLLQAYGLETDFFSINRAPGGTFGNRNFVAHMAAFGLPVLLLVVMRAHTWRGAAGGAFGAMLVVATLFLTRSRAAWLAGAAVLVVLVAALLASPALRRDRRTWLRLGGMVVLAAAGIGAALMLPNSLDWRSDSPYLESMRDVANYQEGSGRGRLVQYRRSLAMAAAHPVLGVGPGNWPVAYADYAESGDPSMDRSAAGMTSNPWPSSDWVALVSERGAPAALLLLLAGMGLAVHGLRRVFTAAHPDEAARAATLLATLLATAVAGLFDAVLLLALPTLLVWTTLGLLYDPQPTPTARAALPPRWRTITFAVAVAISVAGAVRSIATITAVGIHVESGRTSWLRRAAVIDPGNYRIRLELGRGGSGLGRDERCRHARAAHGLYPNAREARRLSDACD